MSGWRLHWLAPALLIPAAAIAEQAVRVLDPGEWRFWLAFLFVQGLAGLGWCASSLALSAGWIDSTGGEVAQLERRLKILQGGAICILASNLAYYGGFYGAGWAEIYCFGAAALAAYGGDKFVSPLFSRLTGKISG